jgi:hypothetical protein
VELSSEASTFLSTTETTACNILAAHLRCFQEVKLAFKISSPECRSSAPYMLKALGAMIASEHTSCICATVHVAFSLSAAVVRWQTSLTRQAGAYFHFSDSTSDCMHVAAPAATGSSFPTSEERDSNSCLLSLVTGTLLAHPSTHQLLYMKEEKEMYGTTKKWHMSTCKKDIWDYTKMALERL